MVIQSESLERNALSQYPDVLLTIPLCSRARSIIKLFASSKDDRRRVEKALDVSGLPSGKGELLPLAKLQFEDFFNLYKNLTQRSDVEKIFEEL